MLSIFLFKCSYLTHRPGDCAADNDNWYDWSRVAAAATS